MNQQLKTEWVQALRSGKYKQGRKYLRKGDKFCCLGVLADIIDSSAWEDRTYFYRWKVENYFKRRPSAPKYVSGLLPDKILSAGWQNSLTSLNDTGTSFEEIAAWIEQNIEGTNE